jgi:hypothetical protein
MGNLSGQYYLIITTRFSISPNMSGKETAVDEPPPKGEKGTFMQRKTS